MRRAHSLELAPVALRQELQRRNPVEQQTPADDRVQARVRQILVKHAEVVAEVEACLEGRAVGQRAATHMVDHRAGAVAHRVAAVLGPPAEVNLLHVGEEVAVQTMQLAVDLSPHEHRRSRGPEDVALLVILPVVALQGGEDAAAAEGIAIVVDKTARTAGILERVLPVVHQHLGLGDGVVLVAFHHADDGLYPVRRTFHVAVQQHIVVGIHLGQGFVVALGKAIVLVEQYQRHLRIPPPHELHRVVGRPVVGHKNLRFQLHLGVVRHLPASLRVAAHQRIFQYRRQKAFQHPASVPVQNNNSNMYHLIFPFSFLISHFFSVSIVCDSTASTPAGRRYLSPASAHSFPPPNTAAPRWDAHRGG